MTDQTQTIAMSGNIAAAVIKVASGVKRLGKDGNNKHGGYNFTSVDKFYEVVGPMMAEAGLFTMANMTDSEIVRPAEGERGGNQLHTTFDIYLVHESGDTYGPLRRDVAVVASGPQAYASAESFVTKYFIRNLFKVPTGEQDAADEQDNTGDTLPAKASKKSDKAKSNDATKLKPVLEFVAKVNAYLDGEPTAEQLFRYEGDPDINPRMKRIKNDYAHVPAAAEMVKRMNAIYAQNAE